MKRLSPAYCLAAVLTVAAVPLEARPVVQSSPKQTVSLAAVLGHWRGLMASTPAVDLTIKQGDGVLTGTVVFFRIESDSDGNPKVVGQDEVQLQDLAWKSGVLSFGIRRGQDLVRFTMQPTGSATADLKRVAAPNDEPALVLTRQRAK